MRRSIIALSLAGLTSACGHTPRAPANVAGDETAYGAASMPSPRQEIKFAESCRRSKEHESLRDQTIAILNSGYFRHQTGKYFSDLGYEPKVVISEPTDSDCSNCRRIRFIYASGQDLKTIVVLFQQGMLLQTQVNPRTIDFSNAPSELKLLAQKIPGFDGVECEIPLRGAKDNP